MSKKMMKRSLALGALMAFVITGSAMAAVPEGWSEVDGYYVADSTNTDGAIAAGSYDKGFKGVTALEDGIRAINGKVSVGQGVTIEGNVIGGYKNNTTVLNASEYWKGGAENCIVEIDGGTITGNVYGGYKVGNGDNNSFSVYNCTVKVYSGTITGDVYGGYNDANRQMKNNTVEINGGTIIGDVIGGKGGNGSQEYSKVIVNAGTVIGDIYGAKAGNGINCNNTVELNGGVVEGDVYGVYGQGYNNSVTVSGNVNVSGANLYGSEKASDGGFHHDNKLVIGENWQGSIGSVQNFNAINIEKGAEAAFTYNKGNRDTMVTIDNATWTVTGDSTVTTVTGNGNIKVGMASEDAIATVAIKQALSEDTVVNVSGDGAVSDYLSKNGAEAENAFANSVKANGQIVDEEITTEEGTIGGAYTIKVNEDGSIVADQAVNSKSDAVSDAGMTLKGHWRAHMNDMNKRMGDLRMANGETGVWTRMVRGESEYQGAKMQYNQYQLGYDEKLSVDKRWTVGAAVTFSEGDSSYGSGSTDDKSTAFAIYGSKLNNDGTFVDLIARYARLESDLDDRNYGTGDYSTNGMSVSAEFGKRIQQGNGLWIEPQVELTYGTVDSADVTFSKAYKAHYDSMDSFIARAGFALGKDIKQGNVYARASDLYDFDGETETQFEGGKAISEDFGGGWWEVGVGANINLSKATYIYADIEKTFGGEVDTNWQWNLGVRYSF